MKNSDQSAFPLDYDVDGFKESKQSGLTKREYFAGLVMQGIIASSNNRQEYSEIEKITKLSLKYSDELLKQLESNEN